METNDIISYDRFDVEVYDFQGDTVVLTDLMDEDEARELYDKISPSGGSVIRLRKLRYAKPDYTHYINTEIVEEKA